MDTIIEQEKCTGCGACNSSCPKEAIRMHTDKEGFDFPFIDSSKCIDCGICRQVCPPLHYGSREINDKMKIPFKEATLPEIKI